MEAILKKMNSYDFFNNLCPGCIFVWYLIKIHDVSVLLDVSNAATIFLSVCVWYFIGMVINRIGSVIVYPIFWKLNFLQFEKYADFVQASKEDESLVLLSEKNNIYRTLVALCLVVLISELIFTWLIDCQFFMRSSYILLGTSITLLFGWSYHTQSAYISERVRANLDNGDLQRKL